MVMTNPFRKVPRYEKLDSEPCEDTVKPTEVFTLSQPCTRLWKTRSLVTVALLSSFLGFLLATALLSWQPQLIVPINTLNGQTSAEASEDIPDAGSFAEERFLDCGSTRAEAIARGCTLDIMADAWLPQACYHADVAEEALSPDTHLAHLGGAGPNEWYLDNNFTRPIPQESLKNLDGLVGYTWETYHLAHCIYDWQASVRAVNRVLRGESHVYVHAKVLEEEHVSHCATVIADHKRRDGVKNIVTFGLGECIRLDKVIRIG